MRGVFNITLAKTSPVRDVYFSIKQHFCMFQSFFWCLNRYQIQLFMLNPHFWWLKFQFLMVNIYWTIFKPIFSWLSRHFFMPKSNLSDTSVSSRFSPRDLWGRRLRIATATGRWHCGAGRAAATGAVQLGMLTMFKATFFGYEQLHFSWFMNGNFHDYVRLFFGIFDGIRNGFIKAVAKGSH